MRKLLMVFLALTCLPCVGMTGEVWRASWIAAAETPASNGSSQKAPVVVVHKAIYGVSGDAAKQVDLTKRMQQAVAAGTCNKPRVNNA